MGFYGYNSINSTHKFDKQQNISNDLLTVDAYYKIPNFYGIEKIATEEVMDKLDMFQSRSGKIDKSRWWDLEIISTDTGTQFTSAEFKGECQTHGVHLTLAAPEHQEMNRKVETTWRTLRTIAQSIVVKHKIGRASCFTTMI